MSKVCKMAIPPSTPQRDGQILLSTNIKSLTIILNENEHDADWSVSEKQEVQVTLIPLPSLGSCF